MEKVDNLAHDVEMLKLRVMPCKDEMSESLKSVQATLDNTNRVVATLKIKWVRGTMNDEILAKHKNVEIFYAHANEDHKTVNTCESNYENFLAKKLKWD